MITDPDFPKNGSALRNADPPRPERGFAGDAGLPRAGANFPQEADDTALLKRFAAGQGGGGAQAFAVLVRRHTGLVFDIALRVTGSRPLAEEIVQTVFVQLARKAARVVDSRVITAWLHRSALLESRAVLRAESRRRKHTAAAAADMATDFPFSSSSPSPPSATDPRMTELLRSLDEALESLPATEREVLLSHYYGRQSYQEAGDRIGTSEAGARQLAARARKRLAAWFRRRHGADVSISVSGMSVLLAGQFPPAGQVSASSHALLAESAVRSALSTCAPIVASASSGGGAPATFAQCLMAMKLPASLCLLAGFLITFLPGVGRQSGASAADSGAAGLSSRPSANPPAAVTGKLPPGSGIARLTDGFDVGQFEKEMAAVVGLSKTRHLGFTAWSPNAVGTTSAFDLSYGRQMQLVRLVMRQPVSQMPALLAACVRSDPDAKGSMVLEAIFARWTEADPAAARAAMASLDHKVQDYALHAICGTLMSRDVAAAAREALIYPTEIKGGLRDGFRETFINSIIGECSRRNASATVAVCLDAPDSIPRNALAQAMRDYWIQTDAPAATAWFSGVCSTRSVPGNNSAERKSVKLLLKTRPDLAASLAASVPEGDLRNALNAELKTDPSTQTPAPSN